MSNRKKYLFVITLLVLVLVFVSACDNKQAELPLEETVGVFEPNFSEESMLETIKTLSSVDNARIAGFEGEFEAANYISEQFTAMGLEVRTQQFPVKAYVGNHLELKVSSESDRVIKDAKTLSFSGATPKGGIATEIVPLGLGAERDYEGVDVTGKIVLIQRGGEFFYVKTERAAQYGAVAVLFYDPNSEAALSATLTALSEIPAISISRSEGQGFENAIQEGKSVSVSLVVDATHEDSTSSNIIGLYKSNDNPEGKRIIVGAHYDGVDTPAANDNASGTAVILEMAKALSEQKIKLPFDVEFVAFGAEEIGLIGSNHYVQNMTTEEVDTVIAMLNFDMVGVGDSFDIGSAEGFIARDLIKMARETLDEMGYPPTTSVTDRSDHAPFARSGMDAIYIQVGPFLDYHTDFDIFEAIQPEMLIKACELGTKLIVDVIPEKMQ